MTDMKIRPMLDPLRNFPTPWRKEMDNGPAVMASNGRQACLSCSSTQDAIIVAVNAFKPMREALTEARRQLRTVTWNHPDDAVNNAVLAKIDAALAHAEPLK